MTRVVVLGECMVELAPQAGGGLQFGFAGDTFNTAVYMARQGLDVAYATALGDGDPFSDAIRAVMQREGIDQRLVFAAPGRLPGLYAIQVDGRGERRFFYWRDRAPVREIVATHGPALRAGLLASDCLFLSGITLAVIGEAGRAELLGWLREAGRQGPAVAFDPNFRRALWPDAATAWRAFEAILSLCRYVSLSAEDLAALTGEPGEAVAARLAAHGGEVVLRGADLGSVVFTRDGREAFPPPPRVQPVDTTGAGDSYNAAYLASRLAGLTPAAAIARAERLAAAVVRAPGAIIPVAQMPPEL